MLAKLFSARPRAREPQAALPAGERVYAVGDIHGCLDLLDDLLARIDADDRERAPVRTTVIFLGDLVDRGPDSAGVVERLLHLSRGRDDLRFLAGNHEEIFLAALAGEAKALRLFARVGGRETAISYGIDPQAYERADYAELAELLAAAVPQAHRDFLAAFEDLIVVGDYAFVHAGIDPASAFDAQRPADLRWIRERFLEYGGQLDKVVIHGHTIAGEVQYRRHRIGIDTGAYSTGRLTALGLEGAERWTIATS